jgi:hypothetical protein
MPESLSNMPSKTPNTVADVAGPWVEPDLNSGLIQRCRRGWNTPVAELSNELLATYVRQRIALSLVVPEAQQRIDAHYDDDTEIDDDELARALSQVKSAG